MTLTKAVCRKCGKPLDNIPSYLVKGDGSDLFECDNCFYPGCTEASSMPVREPGKRGNRLEGLVEDITK